MGAHDPAVIRAAVILAAGEGRRLRPLTDDLPKVMLPLGGRPLLEHLVVHCRSFGVTDVYVNLFHAASRITDHFGDGDEFGLRMHYLHLDALRPPLIDVRVFARDIPHSFFVLYGDVATALDLGALAGFHRARRADATLVVRPTDHPHDSDLVALAEDGHIQRFVPKGGWDGAPEPLGNAGCYVLRPELVLAEPYVEGTDFIDGLFEPALDRRRLLGFVSHHWMLDIGTPERYQRARREFPPAISAPSASGSARA
jgi:mannose-1-phosphate guanylyltransferase/phosphomannomutase